MSSKSTGLSLRFLLAAAAFAWLAGCDANNDELAASPQAEAPVTANPAAAPPAVPDPPAAPIETLARSRCPTLEPMEPYSAQRHGERLVGNAQGLGPIRLGMTLDQARRAMPDARFLRSPDADGVAFVGVMRGDHEVMSLYANEDDPDAPIDGSRRIVSIQTFSPAAAVDGVAVGDALEKVEAVFGPARAIVESEIEMRQFVEFERQPQWLGIRIDYSGDFEGGSNRTTRYCPGARVMALQLDAPAPSDPQATR